MKTISIVFVVDDDDEEAGLLNDVTEYLANTWRLIGFESRPSTPDEIEASKEDA